MTDPAAAAPLDDADEAILRRLATIHATLDPPPADLDERVAFVVALDAVQLEVARLTGEELVSARSMERTRTFTFEAASRTVMVTIVDRSDDLVRIDGWLAPAAAMPVELRLPDPAPARRTTADDTGRFVFEAVPHGLAQLLVHPAEAGAPVLVTPSLLL